MQPQLPKLRLVAVAVAVALAPTTVSARLFGALTDAVSSVSAAGKTVAATYTQNSLCLKKFCINPIIPGMMQFEVNQLEENSKSNWTCVDDNMSWRQAGFCKQVVSGYSFSLPAPADGLLAPPTDELIYQQEKKATSVYVAHMAAMGMDFWDYPDPWNADDCIKSVWKMACYTHFPRCNKVDTGLYLRPCASSCQDYLKTCGVECCDEGVQCMFTHQKVMADGSVSVDQGYAPHSGPSLLCTGGAARSATSGFAAAMAFLTLVTAIM